MVLRGLLEICERESEKKSQGRRVNVLPHVSWSFLLLRSEEREYVLCHVDRLFLLLATVGQWGNEKRTRNGLRGLLCCPGEVTRAEWHQSFSLGEIYKFELQRPKQFPHKIIIWNSFCYSLYSSFLWMIYQMSIIWFEILV